MATTTSVERDELGFGADIDPMLFAILTNRYSSITEEMTYSYERAAASPVISLARDFSCALLTGNGSLIAIWEGCPHHVTGLHVVVREMIRVFENDVDDGDVIVTNHAYSGNTHIGDLVCATPIVLDGRVVFWSVAKGHQLDVGAHIATSMPHTATNVWQEGIQIPPMKMWEKGKLRKDVFRMYLANVRYPHLIEGDFYAQMGSVGVGKRRLLELISEYGLDLVLRYSEALLEYSNRRASAEIATWPDGVHEGVSWLDSDGTGETNIEVRAKLIVEKGHLTIDFSGSAPQVTGFTNSSIGTTTTSAILPIMCAISSDIPRNQGSIDCVTVIPGELGTITNARWPASCAGCTCLTGDVISEAVWKAITQANPDIGVAAMCKCTGIGFGCGLDRRTGEPIEYAGVANFNSAGGFGASKGHDGWPSATTYGGLGGLRFMDIELQELLFPILYERLEIEPNASGAGEWIGGPGIRTEIVVDGGTFEHFVFGEGSINPPFGALGGYPGIGGGHYIERNDGRREFYNAKAHLELGEGDRWVCVASGGGGYGHPYDRDEEQVARDVRDGFFTPEVARERFGTIVDENGVLDRQATRSLRAQRAERPFIDPTSPGEGTWYRVSMRPGEELIIDKP
jgi:N-methylhydantoinase B